MNRSSPVLIVWDSGSPVPLPHNSMDSVLDNQTEHTGIEVNNIIVCKEQITRTIHELICYTHSNLRLKIQFKAISNKKQIIATIHSDGSISLR